MARAVSEGLDQELIAVDGLAIRWSQWGRDRGTLHPLEAMKLLHDGATLGGGPTRIPEEIAVFDEELEKAPKATAKLLRGWYETGAPARVVADRLGVSRATFWAQLKHALWYMKGVLRGRGIGT